MVKRLKAYGQGEPEELDTTPVEMPLGAMRPRSLQEIIATMVHSAVSAEKGEDFESYEEADDFEPEDEDMMLLDMSPYTITDAQADVPFEAMPEEPAPGRSEAETKPSGDDLEARLAAIEAKLTGDSSDLNSREPE